MLLANIGMLELCGFVDRNWIVLKVEIPFGVIQSLSTADKKRGDFLVCSLQDRIRCQCSILVQLLKKSQKWFNVCLIDMRIGGVDI